MPSITSSDQVRLEYTESGDPAGRPVVLIAGFMAAATSWMFQTGPLANAGYRVIAFDARGQGKSEKPGHGYRMARRGKDLGDLLEALDLHDAVLVGQSMGASSIWSYLGLFDASRVSGIVSIDQTPRMLNDDDWKQGFYGYTRETLGSRFEHGVPDTGVGTPMMKRGMRLVRLVRAVKIRPGSAKPVPLDRNEIALLNDHALQDWRDVITRVTVPALFVAGAESEFWPAAHAAESAALNPLASSAVVANAGHATNIEQHHEFNRVLLGFVAGL
jgi:pimeloyl-ACP methyl ester carboxylesterase